MLCTNKMAHLQHKMTTGVSSSYINVSASNYCELIPTFVKVSDTCSKVLLNGLLLVKHQQLRAMFKVKKIVPGERLLLLLLLSKAVTGGTDVRGTHFGSGFTHMLH